MYVGRDVKCLILTMFGVPRQVFVKAPNIAFGENPSSAGLANNASGQTGGHDRHRRLFDVNATEPKKWFWDSGRPAARIGCVGDKVLHLFLRFYAFSTVLNFADLSRCVVTETSRRTRNRQKFYTFASFRFGSAQCELELNIGRHRRVECPPPPPPPQSLESK